MKIGVIGATGGTGSLIVSQLIDAGHDVRGIVRRDADKEKVRAAGAEATTLDLVQAGQDAPECLSGLDAVINAAAARSTSGGQARAVDRDGVKAAIDAAKQAGVRRWIQISMWGSDDPNRLPGMLRETAEAKRAADEHLAASGMTWTVIRPPWLTNSPADDHIIVGDQVEEGSIPRADVAAVAIACLEAEATHDRLFEVTGGGEKSIPEALAGLG
jgi:uncharacterized protein YbjT (DUF2867 family)